MYILLSHEMKIHLCMHLLLYCASELCLILDMEWKTIAFTILVVSLCFLAIPIKVDPDNNEDIKLFQNYVVRYNKSYRNDPSEYEERFKRFQVSHGKSFIKLLHKQFNFTRCIFIFKNFILVDR